MSENHDIHKELWKLWQDKMQEFWRDPKVIESMLSGYANMHEGWNAFYAGFPNNNNQSSAYNHDEKRNQPNGPNSDAQQSGDVLVGLRNAILDLTQRIEKLERGMAQSSTRESGSEK